MKSPISASDTLPDMLEARARADPQRVLFTFHDAAGEERDRLTYHGLCRRAAGVARALYDAGIRSGDRVLIAHPPGLDLIVALFGAMRIGALAAIAPVTASAGLGAASIRNRIGAIRADCAPRLAMGLTAQKESARDLGLSFLATDQVPSCEDAPHTTGKIAFLQYTSGSTRQPRGVAVTHGNVIANARALIDHPPVGATWLPMFHDMGLIGHVLFPVVLGGACHGMRATDFLRRPESWLHLATAHRATYAATPPFGLDLLLRRLDAAPFCAEGVDLSALRVLMVGAEPVPSALVNRARERLASFGLRDGAMVVGYGLAEATLAVTRGGTTALILDPGALQQGKVSVTGDTTARAIMSCGSPLPGLDVTIRELRTGRPGLPGRVGEICVTGPSVTAHDWQTRDAPARRVLRTGDLGFLHGGALYVCGRADEVIIRRGENHHPQDIEAAAGQAGAAAFVDSEGLSTLLVEATTALAPDKLRARISAETGLELDRIVVAARGSVARTTSGKIARTLTRERLEMGQLRVFGDTKWGRPDALDALDWLAQTVADAPTLRDQPLEATGITSLQLVEVQLALERRAEEANLAPLTEALDGPALQAVTSGAVLDLAAALANGQGAAKLLQRIAASGAQAQERDKARMLADAGAPLVPPRAGWRAPAEALLLTGATGFLGAQLLAALLRARPLPVIVLARGTDMETARDRVLRALASVTSHADELARRIEVLESDLGAPGMGLSADDLRRMEHMRLEVYHNAAQVDYVRPYDTLRPANVCGTRALLDLSLRGAVTRFHHVSSTFIFGWTRKPILYETDRNAEMSGLDFGYSQTKWVAEQLVSRAQAQGLPTTIYRPSLISVPASLEGDTNDVAARLLAFMIRHQVAVDTPNQISLVPVDTTARNLVALSLDAEAAGATYHMTADRYYSLTALTRRIAADFGYRFRELSIPEFIAYLNREARPDDPVYPLLDFFDRCAPQISAMTLKRYDNRAYRTARDRSPWGEPDPGLGEIGARLVRFVERQGWLNEARSLNDAPA